MDREVSPTVLVIDDDPLSRALLRDSLDADFAILEAADGPEGLVQARQWTPDLILLDVLMPGLDGYATAERLKADPATAAIPVLFLTSSRDRGLDHKAYACGVLACLPKPVRREALLALLHTILAQHHASPTPSA